MTFYTEPTGYQKTILSDLQGAWGNLRESVVDNPGFDGWERILFHIDEAMSWESVRNLDSMKTTLLLIRNLACQTETPDEILELIEDVTHILDEVFTAIRSGKVHREEWFQYNVYRAFERSYTPP
jgi:hypothetical protein